MLSRADAAKSESNSGACKEGRIQLTVADDGVGFPSHLDFRNTDTLGMQLVHTLSQQIGGSIELHSNEGTEFRISFSA